MPHHNVIRKLTAELAETNKTLERQNAILLAILQAFCDANDMAGEEAEYLGDNDV